MNKQTVLLVGQADRFQQKLASFLSNLDLAVDHAICPGPCMCVVMDREALP